MKKIAYVWATFFGSGYSPVASGTAGSLAAVPFAWFFAFQGIWWLAAFALFTLITGIWSAGFVARDLGGGDPSIVVIDEVMGQAVAMLMIPAALLDPYKLASWVIIGASFIFFRIFDIVKPFPASWFDKNLKGGWGIMLDDLAAGLYAMFFSYALCRLIYI